jgi:hypothetical protein
MDPTTQLLALGILGSVVLFGYLAIVYIESKED